MNLEALDWEDPGWPWLEALLGFIPLVGPLIVRRRQRSKTILANLRRLYIALVYSPLLLLIVLSFLDGSSESGTATVAPRTGAAILAVIGVACVLLSERYAVREVPLTESQVVGGFRAVFFLRWALSNAPIIAGLVMFFLVGGRLWVYVVGLVIGMIGILRMAPSKSSIEEWDRRHYGIEQRPSLGSLLTTQLDTT